ncbi:DNA mismatch repair endonuclease MutL [Candidatus Similichlamydia epinepheli]|uniref:DNA mismatch repair endonuclease MutL n=1 Tax=Candidatus Similichlamydia epinepheli TaxID=1903953 RepID=UPI001863DAA3|nr:DNA mismatch repair endonuclease MutL [Candidatus Similichlamydia epinepheli]
MKIKILREEVAMCIAAGEVVESPACVVKELIENSLDARSQSIHLEICGGGFDLVRVTDDGIGLSEEEAFLCIQRHATSKLSCVKDLDTILSFGFRGEALAAISAVSYLDLASSDGHQTTKIEVEGGKVVSHSAFSRDRGTTISVRNLFYNVPARKRFQKSVRRTNTIILRVFSELALAHPECQFSLIKDGEIVFDLPATSFDNCDAYIDRIDRLLGKEFALSLIRFEAESPIGKLFGWLTRPDFSFSYRTSQYFFLNNRSVFSPILSKSISEAYNYLLPQGRVAGCILFLNMDGRLVDVNVHPRKREVRFQDEKSVMRFVQDAIVNRFSLGQDHIEIQKEIANTRINSEREELKPPVWNFLEKKTVDEEESQSFHHEELPFCPSTKQKEDPDNLDWSRAFLAPLKTYALLDANVCREAFPNLFNDDEWVLVDCLQALFLLGQRGCHINDSSSQILSIPIERSFVFTSIDLVEEILTNLTGLGIAFVRSGPCEFAIHEIPCSWSREDAEEFLGELAKNPSADYLSWSFLTKHLPSRKRIRLHSHIMRETIDKLFLCINEWKELLLCFASWSPSKFFRRYDL